jgi:hypothetical protein
MSNLSASVLVSAECLARYLFLLPKLEVPEVRKFERLTAIARVKIKARRRSFINMPSLCNMWILLFLITGGYSQDCPVNVSCLELEDGLCARVARGELYLNGIGCPSYEESCKYEEVMEFYSQSNKESLIPVTMPCSKNEYPYSDEENKQRAEYICNNRETLSKEKLANGSHLKACNSDDDCLLENGNKAKCECSSLLGYKFCSASLGDDIFSGIFDLACQGEYKRVAYMHAYAQAFIPLIANRACFDRIYTELIMYSALQVDLTKDRYIEGTSNSVFYSIGYLILSIILL